MPLKRRAKDARFCTTLAKGSETRVWGRFADGPGTPLKGEKIPDEVKALFRAK